MNTEELLITLPGYKQHIQCQTTSGMHGKRIDQAYARLKDFSADGFVLYKSFSKSHHHPHGEIPGGGLNFVVPYLYKFMFKGLRK